MFCWRQYLAFRFTDPFFSECPNGYIAQGGWECYKLVDNRPFVLSWYDSWDSCKKDGAILVAIETPWELLRVRSMLQQYTIPGRSYLLLL